MSRNPFANGLLKPILIFVVTLLIGLFILFNLNFKTDISFIFFDLQAVPVIWVIVLAFLLGSFFILAIFLEHWRKGRFKMRSKEEIERLKHEKAQLKEQKRDQKK
ncbi:MAG: hypothetical protein CVV50_03970 [Spirochaetae bacterium HGW-Spirochaetae-6]|nr:MAG: hypothetical protein CVV50_03970 [Spirochaetae bacterium HGW-Spirochaetae-6]